MIVESLDQLGQLVPGTHVVLLTEDPCLGVAGRLASLEIRDAFTILGPSRLRIAWLRKLIGA
jgi:hypothetical protein